MDRNKREEYIQRIEKIEKVLLEELNLYEVLNSTELEDFLLKFIPYIKHGRDTDEVAGRTPETIERDLKNYITFCKKINLTDKEIITSIKNFPAIIREANEKLVDKFILLSVVENEENTLRKTNLINRPEDFIVDIRVIYARLMLMRSLLYSPSWNSLVKASQTDFAKIFVKSKHNKPYKVFENETELSSYKLKQMYPIDYEFINSLKELEINNMFLESGKTYE